MGHRDDSDFVAFAESCRPALRRTAYLMCGDWERAADFTQEALIRVYVAWPRLRQDHGLRTYARKAVVSVAIEQARKRSSREVPATHLGDRPVEDAAERVVDRVLLMTALAELPPRQRACVVLRYYDDLSVEAVAEALGVALARSRVRRRGVSRLCGRLTRGTAASGWQPGVTMTSRRRPPREHRPARPARGPERGRGGRAVRRVRPPRCAGRRVPPRPPAGGARRRVIGLGGGRGDRLGGHGGERSHRTATPGPGREAGSRPGSAARPSTDQAGRPGPLPGAHRGRPGPPQPAPQRRRGLRARAAGPRDGVTDWLPDATDPAGTLEPPGRNGMPPWLLPVQLTADQLVLLHVEPAIFRDKTSGGTLLVFDRGSRTWHAAPSPCQPGSRRTYRPPSVSAWTAGCSSATGTRANQVRCTGGPTRFRMEARADPSPTSPVARSPSATKSRHEPTRAGASCFRRPEGPALGRAPAGRLRAAQ